MRSLSLAVLLTCFAPALAAADDAEVVRLRVGETKAGVGTVRPMCDAPTVAVISEGSIRAVGPGETVCSVATVAAQGMRRVYRVVVTARDATQGDGASMR